MTAQEELRSATPVQWSSPRLLVVLVAFVWLLLAAPWPASLNGTGMLVVLALAGLDILLGVVTGWLAFCPSSRLDEWQRLLRDRAYRIAFRMVAIGVLLMLGLTIVGGIVSGRDASFNQVASLLPDGFAGRTIIALLELLAMLPTLVVAWLHPGDVDGHLRPTRAWLPFAAVPLLALVWLAVVSAGPDQLITKVGSNNVGFSEADASCEHYAAQRRVAFGFGGAIRAGVEVCWNGRQAFVFGNPSLTPPGANLPVEGGMPYLNDLFSCEPFPSDTDFASVSEHCAEQIDADGTMRLTVSGVVSPAVGLAQRQLRIELVVDRNGKVIRFD